MSGFTPLLFTYVFAAVFLAGIVRGATGFGFSMIMIVLLTLFFPPAQVAPVILFWEVLASIGHLPFVYRQVHWKSLRWLALGVALGTPFGVYCLVSIPVDAMRLIINAVVLILTSMLYCGLRPKNAPTPPQTTGVGLLAGIINGASANGGPPIILFFLSSPLGAAVGRASLIAFFLFTDVWASLFYWQQGLISLDTVIFTLVFMVPMFGGMWFGNRWFSTVDEARFRKVVLALLMLISIVGLVKALWPGMRWGKGGEAFLKKVLSSLPPTFPNFPYPLRFTAPPDDLADDADGLGHVAAQVHFDGVVTLIQAAEKHPMAGQRLDLLDVDFLVDTHGIDRVGINLLLALVDEGHVPVADLRLHAVAVNLHEHHLVGVPLPAQPIGTKGKIIQYIGFGLQAPYPCGKARRHQRDAQQVEIGNRRARRRRCLRR